MSMIAGAHFLLYTTNPEADRAFLRDVLELRAVDAGHGWLIFALPPSEVAVHPTDDSAAPPQADAKLLGAELYFMTRDVRGFVASLERQGVSCAPIDEARWGSVTSFALPSGGKIGVYQPKHPTAISMD
jgi:catechol 2,3-dioxygenase-like lactoylglutathione lyase family enzyme